MRETQEGLIKEAVSRELLRGGQVFYLHNEVKTIERTAAHLREIVPQARIGIAHGQMAERELEQNLTPHKLKKNSPMLSPKRLSSPGCNNKSTSSLIR